MWLGQKSRFILCIELGFEAANTSETRVAIESECGEISKQEMNETFCEANTGILRSLCRTNRSRALEAMFR